METINETVGKNLRRIRKSKNWTLQEVEQKSRGIHKQMTVGSYERGDRAMNIEKITGLAEFYQVSLIEILGLQEQAKIYAKIFQLEEQLTELKEAYK